MNGIPEPSHPRHASICQIYLLDSLYHIDKLYDYFIPFPLRGEVEVGGFVAVPFGKTTRHLIGLVVGLTDQSSSGKELKPIFGRINRDLVLSEEQLQLASFLKKQTFCTMGDAVRAMLPTAAFAELMIRYELNEEKYDCWTTEDESKLMIGSYIRKLGMVPKSRLVQRFGVNIETDLREMVTHGVLIEHFSGRGTEEKTTSHYRLAITPREGVRMREDGKIRGAKQIAFLNMLLDGQPHTVHETAQNGISSATCESLIKMGVVVKETQAVLRDPFADLLRSAPAAPSPLSPEQSAAYAKLRELIETGEPKAALLHGVTGSGKTSVMKAVIDEVIRRGKTVILLVPEIALTPQTVSYFRSFYGDRTAVLHSMLSAGERYDAWMRIKRGEVDLCIGTRSAVFAPMPRLGAILIDEEHEHTYKSDSAPKYHAIDIARFRCGHHRALMLLASATPSSESYFKAQKGIYTLISLQNRYGGAPLPTVSIADMRKDAEGGRLSPIGSELAERLRTVLARGEQAILFVNRRGYDNFLSCPTCGHVISCPHCSVSLTRHTSRRDWEGVLRCHYCGHTEPPPERCPSCHQPGLRHVGYGTQRAEEELRLLFPTARILRMDADTTSGKSSHREILDLFRRYEADILIGTQMVTKGHDFPRVTLVGVLNADGSLYLDDYRAAERTFSLMTQVIGRAGRGSLPGEALIQTSSPHHPLFSLVSAQDYPAFFEQEIALRRSLSFPPFCDLVTLTVSGREETEVSHASNEIAKQVEELRAGDFSALPLQMFGPMEASIYRINEVYRMRTVFKCRLDARTRSFFSTLLEWGSRRFGRKTSITLDVNPENV